MIATDLSAHLLRSFRFTPTALLRQQQLQLAQSESETPSGVNASLSAERGVVSMNRILPYGTDER